MNRKIYTIAESCNSTTFSYCIYIYMQPCNYRSTTDACGLAKVGHKIVTGFWKTDHIVTREINRISMSMLI